MTDLIATTIAAIEPVKAEVTDAARGRWASRAKPPGSLGRIEDIGVRVAGIVGQAIPDAIEHPAVAVFAGDHGVVAAGASAWPQEITAAMVANMATGGAAINAFAATVGATVRVVDVGVATPIPDVPGVIDAKIRPGTADLAAGPAMTLDEARAAVEVGISTAQELIAEGADLIVGGEMGIGNTTPSAALIATFADADPAVVTGPGAGLPAEEMDLKRKLVSTAVDRARAISDPLERLAEVGGLEIAALAGLHIGAAAAGVPVITDGVIAVAALCLADALAPGTAARSIAGHRSTEPACTAALEHLGMEPVLDLDLRLGEGTGACLAVPVVQAAVNALRDMADLPNA